jgi:SAM-dependent methyltransferase
VTIVGRSGFGRACTVDPDAAAGGLGHAMRTPESAYGARLTRRPERIDGRIARALRPLRWRYRLRLHVGERSRSAILVVGVTVLLASVGVTMAGVHVPGPDRLVAAAAGSALVLMSVLHVRTGFPLPRPGAQRPNWEESPLLFPRNEYVLAYTPLINNWVWEGGYVQEYTWDAPKISLKGGRFRIPDSFRRTTLTPVCRDDPSCRLDDFTPRFTTMNLVIQECSYLDHLLTGEHLDEPIGEDPADTYRHQFGQLTPDNLVPKQLTNLCGVGVFLLTSDGRIVVSKHSDTSHVYPGRLTFSASGVMKWGACPNPFMEVARRAFIELDHQIDPDRTRLLTFGADSRKLYYQFGFIERTAQTAGEVSRRHLEAQARAGSASRRDTPEDLEILPVDLHVLVDRVVSGCWEPAAEACLLTLCARRFGAKKVRAALRKRKSGPVRHQMIDEWDLRASSPGDLPDMTIRYGTDLKALETEKIHYVEAVIAFIGTGHLKGRNVLEVGCGTGRITARIVDENAATVTCVDLCAKMVRRNQLRLGGKTKKVYYHTGFIQEYEGHHDVAICSLVLIHNGNEEEFDQAVKCVSRSALEVFVFEDVTYRPTSPTTTLRDRKSLVKAFARHGMQEERRGVGGGQILHQMGLVDDGDGSGIHYNLHGDTIAFMKFVPAARSLELSVLASPRPAGLPAKVRVTARDERNKIATGYAGTVRFTSSDPMASLPPDYQFTPGDRGVHVFPGVTLKTAGTHSLEAADNSDAGITGIQSGIVVT